MDSRQLTPDVTRIDRAFRAGDLAALREAVGEASLVPNGRMPDAIGSCLVYAIYHSPVSFVRTLLDLGADPNVAVDDGFPPLIAALATTPGTVQESASTGTRADDILSLLLDRGADPHQRGVNDDTPLHLAVAAGDVLAVQRLLDAGADPECRTRIDDRISPLELARARGHDALVALLERRGAPRRERIRGGLCLLWDVPGAGPAVQRQHRYLVRLRTWLASGARVRWSSAHGPVGVAQLSEDGWTLETDVVVNRGRLISGLFYGMDGMRVGGTRRLEMAPHLAYGERGVPGSVPPDADLIVEVTVIEALV